MTDDAAVRGRVRAAARALLAGATVPSADAVAAAAGISRATYYRLVGSHRAFLREVGHVEEPSARERLLDAAAAALGEVGLTGLVMDAVAERAGVSYATLYRLFPGKAELLAALTHRQAPLAALRQALARLADGPPEEVLPELVVTATPQLLANRGVLRAILAETGGTGPDAAAGRAAFAGAYAAFVEYLRGQMDAGRLRKVDPRTAVQSLLGPLLVYAMVPPDSWAEAFGELPPPEQTLTELVDIWVRGMQPASARA